MPKPEVAHSVMSNRSSEQMLLHLDLRYEEPYYNQRLQAEIRGLNYV